MFFYAFLYRIISVIFTILRYKKTVFLLIKISNYEMIIFTNTAPEIFKFRFKKQLEKNKRYGHSTLTWSKKESSTLPV